MFGGAYNTMAALHSSSKTQGGPVTVVYNMAVCPYNNTLHGSKSWCHWLHQMLTKTKITAKTCLWLHFLCNSAGLAVHRPVVWSNQRDKLNFRKVVLHTTDLLPPHYESWLRHWDVVIIHMTQDHDVLFTFRLVNCVFFVVNKIHLSESAPFLRFCTCKSLVSFCNLYTTTTMIAAA